MVDDSGKAIKLAIQHPKNRIANAVFALAIVIVLVGTVPRIREAIADGGWSQV